MLQIKQTQPIIKGGTKNANWKKNDGKKVRKC